MNDTAELLMPKLDESVNSATAEMLDNFLHNWDCAYREEVKKIDLFNTIKTSKYSYEQKEFFARAFYHVRGHFHKFLWMLGNHAPDADTKNYILYNIQEEFGGNSLSHEQLYFEFARALGLDVSDEFLTDEHHLPFIKEFNLQHLVWLSRNDWPGKWSLFSAYERLDNIDYANLLNVAKSVGVTGRGLIFFEIHNKADHFDRTYRVLSQMWVDNQKVIVDAFNFISSHQLAMWQLLSDAISYRR